MLLPKPCWILLILGILNQVCAKAAKREIPSYLQLGAYGLSYQVNATGGCWSGAWLPDSMPGDCVCVKGIWVVSSGYCDEKTTIYTGDGHCFRMDRKRRVKKLFNMDNNKLRPFTSSNYLISRWGHDFVTVKDTFQASTRDDWDYLIRVNPKKPMFMKTYLPKENRFRPESSLCAPSVRPALQKFNSSKYILITDISGRNHFNFGKPGWCPRQWMKNYWILTIGQSFRLNDRQITEGAPGNPVSCAAARVLKGRASRKAEETFYFGDPKPPGARKIENVGPINHPDPAATVGVTVDPSPVDYEIEALDDPPSPGDLEPRGYGRSTDYDNIQIDLRWPIEPDHEAQVRQVEIQTARLGAYYMEWVFNQKRGPTINHVREWEYVKLARKLMLKTCKSPVVTPMAINNLFRWFRWVVRESLEVFPYVSPTDNETHGRIMAALTRCVDESREMTFSYDNTCNFNKVVSVSHGSDVFTETLDESVRFDIARLEPAIELAWKLMMNTHYYCADYFSDYPTDHSTLSVKFEHFLSPLVRKRWTNPGKSFQLMQSLWATYKLTPVFEAVDFCVSASHTSSTYKKLLVRPINEEPTLFPGSYPGEKPFDSEKEKLEAMKEKLEKRRKKRDVAIPLHRNLWGHWGYCLEYANDAPSYGATGRCVN